MELTERINLRPIHWLSRITYNDFAKDCMKNSPSKLKEPDIKQWFTITGNLRFLYYVTRSSENEPSLFT